MTRRGAIAGSAVALAVLAVFALAGAIVADGANRHAVSPIPPAGLMDNGGAWPVAGRSYATYHVRDGGGSPGGDFSETYEGNVTMRYTAAGTWTATCDGVSHHFDNWGGFGNDTYTPFHATTALAPPMWPVAARLDENVTGKVIVQCHDQDFSTTVVGSGNLTVLQDGQPEQAATHHAYYEPCPCAGYEAQWARHQGILLKWWHGGMAGGESGELVDTDASVA